MYYDLVYNNQFITVMFREGEQHLLVALTFHTVVSHAHKPQLKMEESTTAEESDMTEKELTKKRLPTKVIIILMYIYVINIIVMVSQ